MGHGRCGGIQAALDPDAEPLSPGDFIGRWMSWCKPAAEQIQSNDVMTAAERQTALERVSIRNSIANLRTFPYVKTLEEAGKLQLSTAPGSTSRPANSGSWTPRPAISSRPGM